MCATHGTIRTAHTSHAASLKTTTHPKTRCRKPYAATQHLCSWWWANIPETCRAKNILISYLVASSWHQVIPWGRCMVKQPSNIIIFMALMHLLNDLKRIPDIVRLTSLLNCLHLQMITYMQSSQKRNILVNITALIQHLSSHIQKVKLIAVVTPCAFVTCWLRSGFNLKDKISHTYQELFMRTLKLIVIWLTLCKKNKTVTTFLITSDKSLKFPFTLNHIRDKVCSSSSITEYYIP